MSAATLMPSSLPPEAAHGWAAVAMAAYPARGTEGVAVAVSLWVALGSAMGGLLRHWMGVWVAAVAGAAFPWGTLAINVAGSFVIGLVAAGIAARGWDGGSVDLRAFVMVGVCGGFTTFSSFSLQTLELLQAGRHPAALAYIGASVLLCLTATWAGAALIRGW